MRYNDEYLQTFCRENTIELVDEYKNVNRETRIRGKCKTAGCDTVFEKSVRCIVGRGAYFCKECAKNNGKEKARQTNLERYGTICSLHNREITKKVKQTNLERYGVENPSQSEEIKKKKEQTNLIRLGVRHSFQSEKIKEKVRQTNMTRLGVNYPSQSKQVREKVRQTNMERFGVEYASQSEEIKKKKEQTNFDRYGVHFSLQAKEIKEKIKKTNQQRYGAENPFQSEEIKEKIKKTNQQRYGYPFACQNPLIAEKASKSARTFKPYIFPSGKMVKIQGYEHFALNRLLEFFEETDIITGCKNVPHITYLDSENNSHYHTPDIFIPKQNRCIEVKSTWTFAKKQDSVLLKQQYAKEKGLNYEIWIYDAKGNCVEIFI